MTKLVFKQTASEYILETSKEYSIYVCENRAIPKIMDGLKDCQRKALWLMRNKQEKIKTVSLAGECISSGLYLHGDKSASDAISLMAAPYCGNLLMLSGVGTFGTRVAPVDGIASPRYTYVKRSKAAEFVLYRDLDIVPLKDNYDGSVKEPEYFLPLVPLILQNGISGVAIGYSTNILPRNFNDILDATLSVLNGKKIKKIPPKYDYLDLDISNIEGNIWELKGKANILDTSTVRVTELPPDLTLESFKERLNTFEDEDSIYSYTDKSTDKINVEIKFKRGSLKDWDEEKVIDFLKLKQRKTERIVVIDWNGKSIKQYETAEKVIEDFVPWRLTFYVKRYEKLIADDKYELKYWQSLEECFNKKLSERVIKLPNKKALEEEVKVITAKIGPDENQIDKIVNLSTYKWAKDYLNEVQSKINELETNIKQNTIILNDPEKIKDVYRNELLELKKAKF